MLLPIEWLKDFVKLDCSDRELADRLTLSGSHVESISDKGFVSKVVTGKIASIVDHPDADKLIICQVDIGGPEMLQIVTGATNVSEGDIVPVAIEGATLANGLKIKNTKLRGVPSNGMLCSYEELGFSDAVIPKESRNGIMIFPEEVALGIGIADLFKLKEGVIEFEITPNRPDCLSILGMARETAATFNQKLRLPRPNELSDDSIEVDVKLDSEGCLRYYGCVVEDIEIKPSPLWLQLRLMQAGMRPINNIVDVTNYVMLEYNQPLHAFDIDEMDHSQIVVRNGRVGEKLVTLDEVEREVTPDDIMITDGEKLLGFAGVMGGFIGEVTPQTKRIFLESANFAEKSVRLTSKRLNLRTEASTRFEKGLDPNQCQAAAERFCQLVEEIGAGKVVDGKVDVYPTKRKPVEVSMRFDRCNDLLGLELSKEEIIEYLHRLGFGVREFSDKLDVTVPTFRGDIISEVDLIEEVGRLYGFHRISPEPLRGELTEGGKSFARHWADRFKNLFISMGFDEVLTYSFISPKFMDRFNLEEDHPWRNVVRILNPLGEDFSVMRPTQIPTMIDLLVRNHNRGNEEFLGFEIGHIFTPMDEKQEKEPLQERALTWGGIGTDFYFMKDVLLEAFKRTGVKGISIQPREDHPLYHPGRCGEWRIDDVSIGFLGEIHPTVGKTYGMKKPMLIGEINLDKVIEHVTDEKQYEPLPKYPAVDRDLAIVVSQDVLVAEIESIVKDIGKDLLESFKVFDIYEGDQIEEGKKSIAFSLVFRRQDRTLKEEEIQEIVSKIRGALEEKLNASVRES